MERSRRITGLMTMEIKIFPRIHITLLAMHEGEYRKNGGIGFSIKEPFAIVEFKKADRFEIIDNRTKSFGKNEKNRLLNILKDEYLKHNFRYKLELIIDGELPTHIGFGSSSSIRLAAIEGLYILNEYAYTELDLINASNRGGTSGVGINTYFRGGYVFDIGKKIDGLEHLPSSIEKVKELPLKIIQDDMPRDWEIGICIPNFINTKSEKEEKEFFKSICPIEKNEVYKTLYHVIFGVIGSIKDKDLEGFSNAINLIQNCAWKKAERSLYGDNIEKVEKILYKNGALAVGMSSLGPLVFFTSFNVNKVIELSKIELDCSIFKVNVNDKGREIVL